MLCVKHIIPGGGIYAGGTSA